jgi:RTX calcium-binding nonapeptide repeat (4 copies)
MTARTIGLSVLSSLVLASTAQAARVSSHITTNSEGDRVATVTFDAESGEANGVTVGVAPPSSPPTTTVQVADTGAPLLAGAGCISTDSAHVDCDIDAAVLDIVEVHLGDGNDRVRSTGPALRAFGGAGDDRIEGGDDYVDLNGEEGSDTLIAGGRGGRLNGGPGSDHVTGSPDSDTMVDGDGRTASRDFYDGGAGQDTLSYAGRRRPLTVNLRTHRAGKRGEGDRIPGIDGATGGSGADVLIGDRFENLLDGRAGNDRLIGGGGDDTLLGGPGRDYVAGGPGNDTQNGIEAPGRPVADAILCDTGDDEVFPQGFDLLSGCETASVTTADTESTYWVRPVSATPGTLTLRLRCLSASSTTSRCRGRLRLSGGRPRRSYGEVGFDAPVGTDGLDTTETHLIRVPLTRGSPRARVAPSRSRARDRAGRELGHAVLTGRRMTFGPPS